MNAVWCIIKYWSEKYIRNEKCAVTWENSKCSNYL